MTSMMVSMMSMAESGKDREEGKVYANTVMYDMMNAAMSIDIQKNNLTDFKTFLENRGKKADDGDERTIFVQDLS